MYMNHALMPPPLSRRPRHLIEEEVLCAANGAVPVLLSREDALVKLLPKLDRVEARTFIIVAKLVVSAGAVLFHTYVQYYYC